MWTAGIWAVRLARLASVLPRREQSLAPSALKQTSQELTQADTPLRAPVGERDRPPLVLVADEASTVLAGAPRPGA